MKILLLQETDWFEKGPLQQHHLMERLSKEGHEIRVIDYEIIWKTHGKNEFKSKREVFEKVSLVYDGSDITVIRPPIIKIPTLDYISLIFSRKKEIERQINEFKPDVIVGFQILTPYLGLNLAKKHQIPFIYYWTDVYHAQIPFKGYRPLGKYIEKKIIEKSDAVIVINDLLKDYVIKLGSDPEKTYVEKAGIDLNKFDHNIDGEKIREEYNINKNDNLLLFVGWLYNFSGLKETAIQLLKSNSDLKFMIVGEGDAFEELEELVKKDKINVILTGKQPYERIPEFLASADICLLPSFNNDIMNDIVPIKLYEYMAMKKPVIATKLPGVIREFGYDAGIFYAESPSDVVEIAQKIIESHEIENYGSNAIKFVKKYKWENIVNDFEEVARNLIKNKGD